MALHTPTDTAPRPMPGAGEHDAPRGEAGPTLLERYRAVRGTTEAIAAPMSAEDQTVQAMPDASPAKWHRAHTTWFFETLVLEEIGDGYRPFNEAFRVLFNSYYNSVGKQHARPERGLITRPGVAETTAYRAHVDAAMERVLEGGVDDRIAEVVEVGLNHEQQHQELMVTDFKYLLSRNPLSPSFVTDPAASDARTASDFEWLEHPGGVVEIGHDGRGFAYDNEGPRHRVVVEPFHLANRPVTNREFLEFMDDGGYGEPGHWLSDGWATVCSEGWEAPLYWRRHGDGWSVFTSHGERPVDPEEPVCHVSLYEADAYARWAGARLAGEAEWELFGADAPADGTFLDMGRLHPGVARATTEGTPTQMLGGLWEWTRSAYSPYPGYAPPEGALGEYNSKFMCNQIVLRGGSCATPADHIRPTYRNFFPAGVRWQFSGIRLAKDA